EHVCGLWNLHIMVASPLSESVDHPCGVCLHFFPGTLILATVLLKPFPIVIYLDGVKKAKCVGMYIQLHDACFVFSIPTQGKRAPPVRQKAARRNGQAARRGRAIPRQSLSPVGSA